jgi:hypothetical protein
VDLARVRWGLGPGSARGGGGILEPNTKPSRQGSVLANKRRGTTLPGRGDLGGVGDG